MLSPRLFFTIAYIHNRRRIPHFGHPRDLSEIWIKSVLDGENLRHYKLADKYLVRNYITSKGLNHILTPLLGVYSSADEIDFCTLPNKFALKLNYGAGMNIICMDKSKLDEKATRQQLQAWMKRNKHYSYSEAHYNLIERKIVCEQFIEDGHGGFPTDYKFMCVKGKVMCVLACSNRETGYVDYLPYSLDWTPLYRYNKDQTVVTIAKPANLEAMIHVAEKLAEDIDLLRVDLYSDGQHIWFGELTITPAGCIFHSWSQKALDEMGVYYLRH